MLLGLQLKGNAIRMLGVLRVDMNSFQAPIKVRNDEKKKQQEETEEAYGRIRRREDGQRLVPARNRNAHFLFC